MAKSPTLVLAGQLTEPFRPVEVADLDGEYHAFVVRYEGEYEHHSHPADEFIHILEGSIAVEMEEHYIELEAGESLRVPAGVLHKPRCRDYALALIVERKGLQYLSGEVG